jgi:hypothetical protein
MDDGRVGARRVIVTKTIPPLRSLSVPRVGDLAGRLLRLTLPDRGIDRWIALIAMGLVLVVPLAGWTMLRRTSAPPSTQYEISVVRMPSTMPAAPTTSFVIEPIIRPRPARPASSSQLPTTMRTKKRAPSNRQWVASLSHPAAPRRSAPPGHGTIP